MRLNRRYFCAAGAALIGSSCTAGNTPPAALESFAVKLDVFDDRFYDLIGRETKADILAEGFQWSEGPCWDLDKKKLYFTDVPQNKAYSWSAKKGLQTFLTPSGEANVEGFREPGANGLFFDHQSRLLLCNHGRRSVEVVQTDSKTRETLTQGFEGKKFNSPNDIVATRDGHIFFTDPPYGLEGLNDSSVKELPYNGVYHLTPNGEVQLIDIDLTFPNGIAISKDGRALYVSQSDPKRPILMRYELNASYKVVDKTLFFDFATFMKPGAYGLPDGMTLDKAGNIFTTGPGGIYVITPEGHALGRLSLDRASSNCSFGEKGKTLFVTNQDRLLRIKTQTLGLRWT